MTEIIFKDGEATVSNQNQAQSHQMDHRTPAHSQVGQEITGGRTESGSRRGAADLGDRDIIRIGGSETSVRAAIAAGLVTRLQNGALVVSYDSQPTSAHDPFENSGRGPEAKTPSGDPLSDNADHLEPMLEGMDEAVETLITGVAKGGDQMAVANIILDATKGNDASDAAIGQMASRMGMEPEEAQAQFETIRDSFSAQAHARVAKDSGQDAEAIFAWAWDAVPDLMGKAIENHLHNRSTNGYTKVTAAYYEALPTIDPEGLMEGLRANGFTKVNQTRDGKILFSDDSGEMEWKAAIKAGVITPGGKLQRKNPLAASR